MNYVQPPVPPCEYLRTFFAHEGKSLEIGAYPNPAQIRYAREMAAVLLGAPPPNEPSTGNTFDSISDTRKFEIWLQVWKCLQLQGYALPEPD